MFTFFSCPVSFAPSWGGLVAYVEFLVCFACEGLVSFVLFPWGNMAYDAFLCEGLVLRSSFSSGFFMSICFWAATFMGLME